MKKEDISSVVDDPRLVPINPILKLKLMEQRYGISVEDPILPEEFGQRINDVLEGKKDMVRIFAINGDERWVEQISYVVPLDEHGKPESEAQLVSVFSGSKNGDAICGSITDGVRFAEQRFDYVPDPHSVERGEWDDQWDSKKGTWKMD